MSGLFCSFSDQRDYEMKWKGRVVRFDFSDRFGPVFLNKNGEPLGKQPTNADLIEAATRHRYKVRSERGEA